MTFRSSLSKFASSVRVPSEGERAPGACALTLATYPTGSGKTRIVEAAAETLFGDSRALIKVDCAEFQHSHEIAKLIGSPPGLSEAP